VQDLLHRLRCTGEAPWAAAGPAQARRPPFGAGRAQSGPKNPASPANHCVPAFARPGAQTISSQGQLSQSARAGWQSALGGTGEADGQGGGRASHSSPLAQVLLRGQRDGSVATAVICQFLRSDRPLRRAPARPSPSLVGLG
jgi:hypothetical protein